MRRIITVLLVGLVATVSLAACGGSDHGDTQTGMHMNGGMQMGEGRHSGEDEENRPVAPGARPISVTADDLTFAPQRIDLEAGENVAIVLRSEDLEHDFYVDGIGHIVHANAGTTEQGGLVIDEPGIYKFWCTVTGHRQGGMVGTITVTA